MSSSGNRREMEWKKKRAYNYSWSDSKGLLNSLLFIAVSYRVLKCLSLLLNDLVWNVINTNPFNHGKPSGQPASFRTWQLIDFEFMSIHLLCTIIVIILVTNSHYYISHTKPSTSTAADNAETNLRLCTVHSLKLVSI